jgi:hypothetical protein
LQEFLGNLILLGALGAVIFIPGAAVVGLRNRRECRQAAGVATLLGLQLVDRKQDMVRYSGARPVMRLLLPFVPWAMGGAYDGVRVSIGRFGGRLTTHPPGEQLREWLQAHPSPFNPIEVLKGTRYLAWFDKPLPVGMEVRPAGALFGKLEDPDKLVPSGDEALDQRCRIFGENQREIMAWLADTHRRAALVELFRSLGQACVDSESVYVEVDRRAPDRAEAQRTLDALCSFVHAWSVRD